MKYFSIAVESIKSLVPTRPKYRWVDDSWGRGTAFKLETSEYIIRVFIDSWDRIVADSWYKPHNTSVTVDLNEYSLDEAKDVLYDQIMSTRVESNG